MPTAWISRPTCRRSGEALTEAEHLAAGARRRAQIRAQKGGLFRASVDRVTELEAHIDVFEPARRLRLIYLPSNVSAADG